MKIWVKDKNIKSLSKSEQTSHCLRAICWRLLLGTMGFENQKWVEQIFQNIQTYEGWKKEFIKDVKYMESLYMDQESFKKDYNIAK